MTQTRHSYCRAWIINPNDPDMMFVGTGNGIPGTSRARCSRTRDGGASWETLSLPVEPNSVMYWLAMHRDLPGVVVGFSILGQVYVSEDDGGTWCKLRQGVRSDPQRRRHAQLGQPRQAGRLGWAGSGAVGESFGALSNAERKVLGIDLCVGTVWRGHSRTPSATSGC